MKSGRDNYALKTLYTNFHRNYGNVYMTSKLSPEVIPIINIFPPD